MKTSYKTLPFQVLRALVLVLMVLPIYWLFTTSIKSLVDIFAIPPKFFFFKTTAENYIANFTGPTNQLPSLFNSLIVTASSALLSTALGASIAYACVYFKFRGKNHLLFWILSLRMLPPIAFLVPLFILTKRLALADTHIVLILTYCLFNVPLATWLLRSFFNEMPRAMREAALVDGASEYQVFYRVIVPLAAPGLVVTLLFTAIFAWNEFLLALVLTGKAAKTIPVSITAFSSTLKINWGAFAAVGMVMFTPLMIVAIILQKYIVRGLTLGAVKG